MTGRIPVVSCWDFSGIYSQIQLPVPRGEVLYHDMTALPGTNCYCDDTAAEKISSLIKEENNAGIHFADTGNYHYLTYLYLSVLQKKTLLAVFDHHTDMQESAFGGLLSCGGWVRSAQDLPQISGTWVIGPGMRDIEAVPDGTRQNVRFLPEENLLSFRSEGGFEEGVQILIREWIRESLSGEEKPEQIYISVDKDILSHEYASCPWSQGSLSLDELSMMLLSVLRESRKAGFHLAGIDICGESVPEDYDGCIKSEMTDQRLFGILEEGLSHEK